MSTCHSLADSLMLQPSVWSTVYVAGGTRGGSGASETDAGGVKPQVTFVRACSRRRS